MRALPTCFSSLGGPSRSRRSANSSRWRSILHQEPHAVPVERIVNRLIGHDPRLVKDLIETGSSDSSYAVAGRCRLRVNIFRQRGNYGIVMRILATKIPTIGALNLPTIFDKMTAEKTGLILVTGATGSARRRRWRRCSTSSTKSCRPHRDAGRPHRVRASAQDKHVLPARAGQRFQHVRHGVARGAARGHRKVIFVGELRDRETTEIAITAAETGHLVVSTLHTINAGQSGQPHFWACSSRPSKRRCASGSRRRCATSSPAARAKIGGRAAVGHGDHGQQPAHARDRVAGRERRAFLLRTSRRRRRRMVGRPSTNRSWRRTRRG